MTARGRLGAYRLRIKTELESSFRETHSPREVAGSFSLGIFITALPTLGTGLVLFVVLAILFDRISKIALFASVLVLNPVLKWGVYASSFWLGSLILGPVPGVDLWSLSYSMGPAILTRLLLGNVILAVVFALVSYVVVLKLVREYRAREIDPVEYLPDPIVDHLDLPE